jgi:TolB-like protein
VAVREGFRFGPFSLDARACELRRNGRLVRLTGQPLAVLLTLLQQSGEAVTRDDLKRRVWPDGTSVDFEHSLNAAVRRLRAALGDHADDPRYVETLRRRGYRFIGEAESIGLRLGQERAARPRVAVLPFRDLDGPEPWTHFSEGLGEEMIAQLGRLGGDRLAVVGRHATDTAQRGAQTALALGASLHADYLLEGSVRRNGGRIRITARLLEAHEGIQVWAETYERQLSDSLVVQTDVASQVAGALASELQGALAARRAIS